MIPIDLTDRVTLVIGGGRGIGASIVRQAARAGSRIAWTSRQDADASDRLLDELLGQGCDARNAVFDATDERATKAFVEQVISKWARLDNLVYCAGFTSPVALMDIYTEEWRRVVDINLTGAFMAAQAVIPHMKQQARGAIVLIGSAAVTSGGGGRADYVSAKAGLEALNKAITREFAPHGIRCNVVHPSLSDTDLLAQRYPDEEKRRQLAQGVPLRRLGRPEDVANLTVFLLSDLADYVTAQAVLVDGGRSFCA